MKNERQEFEGYAFRKEIEPNSRRIIALEGPVCAGKTTVLESLRGCSVPVVAEYSEYVNSATRDFPKFPPEDEEAAKNSFRFFFELETKRRQNMEAKPGGRVAVLDRSIYTLLAFEVGASRLTGINILPWAIGSLEEHRDEIIIPQQVIYMDIPATVSRARAEKGRISIASFLLTDEFNEGFRDFFMALKEKAPELVYTVDASKEQEVSRQSVYNLVGSEDIS